MLKVDSALQEFRMDEFIGHVVKTCLGNGYTVSFIAEETVTVPNTSIKCSGFFDDKLKLLTVATKREESIWLGVLAHEFCHLTQELESHPYFTDSVRWDEIFDGWLEGLEYDGISAVINQVRDV